MLFGLDKCAKVMLKKTSQIETENITLDKNMEITSLEQIKYFESNDINQIMI